jgi:hypothetical protein
MNWKQISASIVIIGLLGSIINAFLFHTPQLTFIGGAVFMFGLILSKVTS